MPDSKPFSGKFRRVVLLEKQRRQRQWSHVRQLDWRDAFPALVAHAIKRSST
jgi:hypothetical protein